MLRITFLCLAVLGLAMPALAYDINADIQGTGPVVINATIEGYVQVIYEDVLITFDETDDWWSTTLTGAAYAACPDDEGKFPEDPWAGDSYYGTRYYESGDGATIYVNSNMALSMTVTTDGDLDNGEGGTIPTYFTCALAPFQIGGTALSGNVPGSSGHYLYEDSGDFAHGDVFPNQGAFTCAGGSWTLGPMDPQVEGTIKFLARIERNGMQDMAGDYTTDFDVTFSY